MTPAAGRLAGMEEVIDAFGESFRLSDRECEVIRLAAAGLCTKEIGGRLGCATATVHTYWKRIYGKLSCWSREQALAQVLAFVAGHARTPPCPGAPDRGARPPAAERGPVSPSGPGQPLRQRGLPEGPRAARDPAIVWGESRRPRREGTPTMDDHGKLDSLVVPEKPPNKGRGTGG